MASKFTSALAQGGLSGKSKVRARAPDRGIGASGILKSKTTAFKKPHGRDTSVKTPGSKQPQTGQVVVEGRKLQQLQDELRLLRVSVEPARTHLCVASLSATVQGVFAKAWRGHLGA